MHENDIAKLVVEAALNIHTRLGPGLLEAVCEVVLAHKLRQRGLQVGRQVPVTIEYAGMRFEGLLIVELKSVKEVAPAHKNQLLTYLRLADKRLGLLVNFNTELIEDGMHRVVNGMA